MGYSKLIFIIIVSVYGNVILGRGFTKNERLLIKDMSSKELVRFDFKLDKDEQLESIQSQTKERICSRVDEPGCAILTQFKINRISKVEKVVAVKIHCLEYESKNPPSNPDYRVINVLVNSEKSILLLDSLIKGNVQKYFDNIFSEIIFNKKVVFFNVIWDKNTPIKYRKWIYQEILCSYIRVSNKLSIEMYNKNINKLNADEILKIKEGVKWCFTIKDEFPLPYPPSPDFLKYY